MISAKVREGICKYCKQDLPERFYTERIRPFKGLPQYNFYCGSVCFRFYMDEVIECNCPFACKRHTECECHEMQLPPGEGCMFCMTHKALLDFPSLMRIVSKLKEKENALHEVQGSSRKI